MDPTTLDDRDPYGAQAELLTRSARRPSMSQAQQLALLGLLSGDDQLAQVGKVTLDLDARRQSAKEARDAAYAEARLREQERIAAAQAQREFQAEQQRQARAWQEQQREEQRAFQAQQNALMRGVIGGNQSPIAVLGPGGQPIYVNRGEAVGQQPVPAGGGQPSEDERKAAGWLMQARTAYANMQDATKLDPTAAQPTGRELTLGAVPGVGQGAAYATMSPARQKFVTSASSLSEAILRAATGAGVNRDEALQKVQELTPRYGEDPSVTTMKSRMAEMYLDSLAARAGRAAPGASVLPKARAAAAAGGGAPQPPSASRGGWSIQRE